MCVNVKYQQLSNKLFVNTLYLVCFVFFVLLPLNTNHLKHREPLNTYDLKLFGKIVVERARVEKYSQVEKYPTQDYHYRYTEVSKRFCAPRNLNLGG